MLPRLTRVPEAISSPPTKSPNDGPSSSFLEKEGLVTGAAVAKHRVIALDLTVWHR
jgi:hypothetical protein